MARALSAEILIFLLIDYHALIERKRCRLPNIICNCLVVYTIRLNRAHH